MANNEEKFKEVYESRNKLKDAVITLSGRVDGVEKDITYIKESQDDIKKNMRENHVSYMLGVKEIQNCIERFKTDINGLPKNNAKEINQIRKERIEPIERCQATHSRFIWMLLGMAVLISVVLLPIAIEVIPKLFK